MTAENRKEQQDRLPQIAIVPKFIEDAKRAVKEGRRVDLTNAFYSVISPEPIFSINQIKYPEDYEMRQMLNLFIERTSNTNLAGLEAKMDLQNAKKDHRRQTKHWEHPSRSGKFFIGIESEISRAGKEWYRTYYVRGEPRNLGQKVRNTISSILPH